MMFIHSLDFMNKKNNIKNYSEILLHSNLFGFGDVFIMYQALLPLEPISKS